jgi:ubiquitin carboxyl-terminal hydrolase 22/27/51
VQFPLQLNMLPYTNRARGLDPKESLSYELARSCTYDLLSVVVHVGEIDTGHYLAYCRVGDQVQLCFQCPDLSQLRSPR